MVLTVMVFVHACAISAHIVLQGHSAVGSSSCEDLPEILGRTV